VGEKFYFEDIGLRNAIFGYRQTDTGKIMENAVYNHLLYCGYEVTVGSDSNREIDFIARKKKKKIYVQVCYLLHDEKTIEREFGNLCQAARAEICHIEGTYKRADFQGYGV
jgi:predicted AAA+ superfamily ATPase